MKLTSAATKSAKKYVDVGCGEVCQEVCGRRRLPRRTSASAKKFHIFLDACAVDWLKIFWGYTRFCWKLTNF